MNNISDRLRIETEHDIRYIFVDYTGLKEKGMIELINNHLALTLETKLPFLADFNNTFVTPGYMSHAKHFVTQTKNIIDRGALLGINKVKSFILQGVLLTFQVNYKSFKTKEEALRFLSQKN